MTRLHRFFIGLLLTLLVAAPVLAQRAEPIELGDTVEGELGGRVASAEYTFQGEADQLVTITLTSEDFDTFLVLLGPDGEELTVDDDNGPGSLDSRIGPYFLPEDGEYTVIADSYSHYYSTTDDSVEGEFTLQLEESDARRIEYTQSVKADLESDSAQAFYVFRGQQGDVVNIMVESDAFTPQVTLGTTGTMLTSADGSYSETGIAAISGFALPETNNYVLTVSSLYGDGSGEFSLDLNKLEVNVIEFGSTVDTELTEDDSILYYSFEGEAGDIIDVIVAAEDDLDTTLTINGPDSYQVAYADDTNNLNPEVRNLILTQTGTYTVLVQPYSIGNVGEVSVSLERGELVSLDDGSQTLNLTSERTRETLAFTGAAGEQVRLIVEVMKGEQASPNLSITQGQQTLAYASATSVLRQAIDFTVLEDGQVYVQIDEYSYTDVTLQITLERQSSDFSSDGPVDVTAEPVEATVEPTAVDANEEDAAADQTEAEATDAPTEAPAPTVAPTEIPATAVPTTVPTEVPTDAPEGTPEATEAA